MGKRNLLDVHIEQVEKWISSKEEGNFITFAYQVRRPGRKSVIVGPDGKLSGSITKLERKGVITDEYIADSDDDEDDEDDENDDEASDNSDEYVIEPIEDDDDKLHDALLDEITEKLRGFLSEANTEVRYQLRISSDKEMKDTRQCTFVYVPPRSVRVDNNNFKESEKATVMLQAQLTQTISMFRELTDGLGDRLERNYDQMANLTGKMVGPVISAMDSLTDMHKRQVEVLGDAAEQVFDARVQVNPAAIAAQNATTPAERLKDTATETGLKLLGAFFADKMGLKPELLTAMTSAVNATQVNIGTGETAPLPPKEEEWIE